MGKSRKTQSEIVVAEPEILSKIYVLRGGQVMLDRDLAALYNVETKRLKEQVRRNKSHFPPHFMFEITKEEFANLRSQFATSSWGGTRYPPMAFTEYGVLMLSSVLNSERAIQVNIHIMEVYGKIRKMLISHRDILLKLDALEKKSIQHDEQMKVVFDTLKKLLKKPKKAE
jgi:hypothetical protein